MDVSRTSHSCMSMLFLHVHVNATCPCRCFLLAEISFVWTPSGGKVTVIIQMIPLPFIQMITTMSSSSKMSSTNVIIQPYDYIYVIIQPYDNIYVIIQPYDNIYVIIQKKWWQHQMFRAVLSSSQMKPPNVMAMLSSRQMISSLLSSRQMITPNIQENIIIQPDDNV